LHVRIFFVITTALVLSSLFGCGFGCTNNVVLTVPSPSGAQTAIVTLGDCGGATTDFFGAVDVVSENPRLAAKSLYAFDGRPEETGLRISWDSDTDLLISINSLKKARDFSPGVQTSGDLTVKYELRADGDNN
jgi:hypothetical protein